MPHQQTPSEILKVIDYAKKIRSQRPPPELPFPLICKFIQSYYANIASRDLQERSVQDLYGAAVSHLGLMLHRKPKEAKVSFYNPDPENDHWQSRRTILQVVVDDMPFLVDSIRMELSRLGLNIYFTVNTGGLYVVRDREHKLLDLQVSPDTKQNKTEAAIFMEVDHQVEPKKLVELQRYIRGILQDVRVAVEDWPKMQERLREAIKEVEVLISKKQASEELKESEHFLEWLLNNHFTFLGYRQYESVGEGEDKALRLILHKGLGVLRDHSPSKMLQQYAELSPEAREAALSPDKVLIIAKTGTISTVHRRAYTDYISIKRFDASGQVCGEHRFVGLYTSEAYREDPRSIPLVSCKLANVFRRSGLSAKSHSGKDLIDILVTLPRDDLFHATTDEIFDWAMGILLLQGRSCVRLFLRKDIYGRFLSCLVYVPREDFTTDLVLRAQQVLMKAVSGIAVSFTTFFSESVLARIHYVIRLDERQPVEYAKDDIEKTLTDISVSWKNKLRTLMEATFGEDANKQYLMQYQTAFPVSYQEVFSPEEAVVDIELIAHLLQKERRLEMRLYRSSRTETGMGLKLLRPDNTMPLSEAVPRLENMGFQVLSEQSYPIYLQEQIVWINDFTVNLKRADLNFATKQDIFRDAFEKIWFDEVENDSFNRLVLEAGFTWREINIFRAYAKYLKQISVSFSESYIAETLVANATVTHLLLDFFLYRFDPTLQRIESHGAELEKNIQTAFESVSSLDEDRIFRLYLSLIQATVRTNYFQKTPRGNYKSYLSFKLKPKKIPDMPLPLPKYEIFVYSPRFEGVHLRAAKVARGGIRWSDRKEDYRIEVLGLMKAQQVKNGVIVPAGAKGGFVLRRTVEGREAFQREGLHCYQDFIRGLLDLTDNILQNEKVVSPQNTICYDDHDPYLVVAADKGTTDFSDPANQIAFERGYWLGDAFASGGSYGYDHKKMGITARGAWVSARSHFQALNIDLDQAEITVVGIGDMSGDVFGNGMVISNHIKLVAAFNHQHIFLDPNPNPQKSYEERLRLMQLPRSTWEDYNRSVLSEGGGVFSRAAKFIPLSATVKELLGIKKDRLPPNQLIRAILQAPIDLIWNGGIGTYVKGSQETHVDVGDRSNDNLRVNGKELRARVVCEGGNLGFTQLGRIEYELQGGRINTDFIDNSAGVDCSDHEVNIKILLNKLVDRKEITERQRNLQLSHMTEQVAELVLADNDQQNRAIGFAAYLAPNDVNLASRYIKFLSKTHKINRVLEFLPDDVTLLERKSLNIGLTRPELCVLFAYSKIIFKDLLKKSSIASDPYLSKYISYAFPKTLVRRYAKDIPQHYLAKSIIITQLSNQLISEMGITFTYQMQEETSSQSSDIVRAYAVVREIFKLGRLFEEIFSLDYQVDVATQYQMREDIMRLGRRATRWFLRNRRGKIDIEHEIKNFSEQVDMLYRRLPKLLLGQDRKVMEVKQDTFVGYKVPKGLALKISRASFLYHALNIIAAANQYQGELFRVAKIYFLVADRLDLFWFRECLKSYPIDNLWGVLARAAAKSDLDWIQRELTVRVLLDTKARSIPGKIKEWLGKNEGLIRRWNEILFDMHNNSNQKDYAILLVAFRQLFDLSAPPNTGMPSLAILPQGAV